MPSLSSPPSQNHVVFTHPDALPLCFFAGGYPAIPTPFVEENSLSSLNDSGTLVGNLQKLKIKTELPYDPAIPLLGT